MRPARDRRARTGARARRSSCGARISFVDRPGRAAPRSRACRSRSGSRGTRRRCRPRAVRGVARSSRFSLEGARVDDQEPPAFEVREVRAQRGRVHGDEHLGRVARGEDLVRGENCRWEARDATQATRGGADSPAGSPGTWRCRSEQRRRAREFLPVSCMPSRSPRRTDHHRIQSFIGRFARGAFVRAPVRGSFALQSELLVYSKSRVGT